MLDSPILLFDHSAILTSDLHFWRQISMLGTCMVPQVVITEIDALASGFGTDPSHGAIAAEFQRFLSSSSWQIMDQAQHRSALLLSQKLAGAMSRGARLDLAIAEAAFGLAQTTPHPVILVTNTPLLLSTISALHQPNLTAATAATVRSKLQNSRRPLANKAKTNAYLARGHKMLITGIGWLLVIAMGLAVWRSLHPQSFKRMWQQLGLPNLPK